eukprot:scpid76430/ scgid26251/ 
MAAAEKSTVFSNEPAVQCEIKTKEPDSDLAERLQAISCSDDRGTQDTSANRNVVQDMSAVDQAGNAAVNDAESGDLSAEMHFNLAADDPDENTPEAYPTSAPVMNDDSTAEKPTKRQSAWNTFPSLSRTRESETECGADAQRNHSSCCSVRSTYWPLVLLATLLCPLMALPAIYFLYKTYKNIENGRYDDAAWSGLVTRFAAVFALALELILWAIIIAVLVGTHA